MARDNAPCQTQIDAGEEGGLMNPTPSSTCQDQIEIGRVTASELAQAVEAVCV
jgi:hypothetical protein